MSRLWQFATDVSTPLLLVPKFAAAVSIGIGIAGFVPPVRSQSAAITVIVVGLLILAGLSYTLWTAATIAKTTTVLIASIVAFAASLLAYFVFDENFVVIFDDQPNKPIIVGFVLLDGPAALRESDPTLYTDKELLDRYQREPERIWTKGSLATIRISFLAAWTALWLSPFAFLAGCLAIEERRRARRRH
ncbi:MAG: hypothetical protein DWQ37_05410 [Planctomycetota bacterium]|nr:MAG: hypothetical protein DWQ37_05410 [Planctomycetota bacterium]